MRGSFHPFRNFFLHGYRAPLFLSRFRIFPRVLFSHFVFGEIRPGFNPITLSFPVTISPSTGNNLSYPLRPLPSGCRRTIPNPSKGTLLPSPFGVKGRKETTTPTNPQHPTFLSCKPSIDWPKPFPPPFLQAFPFPIPPPPLTP